MRSTWPALLIVLAAHAAAAESDWDVRITPFGQVYPALELSQARRGAAPDHSVINLGEGSGLVAVRLRARHDDERTTLTVDAPDLRGPAVADGLLQQAGREYVLKPPLAWDVRELLAIDAPRTVRLDFRLVRDGKVAGARTAEVSLRPLSEALYFVRDGKDAVDLSWIFAAYVDEHDAVVDEILATAGKSGIVDKFDGYAGTDSDVYRQVWAIWQALAAHGIRYSSADPGIERGPHVFSQRVRLLGQTWADRSANCIDGSVLIASVLQRIGLRSFLVLVPGHAFVGFYLQQQGNRAAYLETTLLGAPAPHMAVMPEFAAAVGEARASELDIAGLAAALQLGQQRYRRSAPRFDRAHRPGYVIIDITEARAFGIRPIGQAASAAAYAAPMRTRNAAPPSAGERPTDSSPR